MQIQLRCLFVGASLIVSSAAYGQAPARIADSLCDARKMQPRDYTECLRKAQEDSDRTMRDRVSAIAAVIDRTTGMPKAQITRWKKALEDSQSLWIRFRNGECQDMTPFETTAKNRVAEEQRVCILDHNERRMGELAKRYPGAGA
ncbi:MAG: lysozyme inhibitor LprI family protein [Beijerinckiaceae bacterium]